MTVPMGHCRVRRPLYSLTLRHPPTSPQCGRLRLVVQCLIQVLAELLPSSARSGSSGIGWRLHGHIGSGEIELINVQRQASRPRLWRWFSHILDIISSARPGSSPPESIDEGPIGSQKGFLNQILGAARISGQAYGGIMEGIQMGQDQGCKSLFASSLLSPFNIDYPFVNDVWAGFQVR